MSPTTPSLLQWLGLILAALVLVVLMGTRWGQARPLSKCVALSIFAHLLLLVYAHGTKLILSTPPETSDLPFRVALVASGDAMNDGAPRDSFLPLEHMAPLPSVLPPIQEPQRFELPVEPIDPPTAALATESTLDHRPPVIPVAPIREIAEAFTDDSQPDPPLAETTAIDVPERLPEELADAAAEQPQSEEAQDFAESTPPAPAIPDRMKPETDPGPSPPASEKLATAAPPSSNSPQANRPTTTPVSRRSDPPESAEPAARAGDGLPLPGLYQLRTGPQQAKALDKFGGNERTQSAVDAALRWLADNQHPDGRWDANAFGGGHETRVLGHDRRGAGGQADTGISGLALLALQGAGNSHYAGPYREQVQRGLEFLLRYQRSDGCLAGEATLFAQMYCHGIACLALSEAYALTGDERLAPYVARAITYTVHAQHPTGGGWRYRPGDRGDMSQFGWQLMALKSAELGGIRISGRTRGGMLHFLEEASAGTYGGLASYRAGDRVSHVMTAEALVCRLFLDQQRDLDRNREAADLLLRNLPAEGQPNLYYWYYATLGLFQLQGSEWQRWNEALQRALLPRQRQDGEWFGSWDPDTVWGGYGGRVYSTAMAALCLEVYYRYLPIHSYGSTATRGRRYR